MATRTASKRFRSKLIMVSSEKIENFKPHLSQIVYQVIFAGMNVIARVSIIHGMNHFVFVTYRQLFATVAIAPFAYVLERKERPQMTRPILLQIFLLACGTTITQNCYLQGMYYTSSTFGSAALNLLPVLTFVMATFLRLEQVNMRSLGGQAKVVGIIICVSGAMVMTLYKGPALKFLSPGAKSHLNRSASKTSNLILGSILVFGSIVIWSACISFQAPVLKRYPALLSLTALACLFGAVQSSLTALICENNNSNVWALGWNFELLGVLYSGIMCSALGMFLQTWCIGKKGPVFVAVFSPIATIVTAILELIIIHIYLRVGSVVGAILIVLGLYCALWGKAKDFKTDIVADESVDRVQF